MFKRLIDGFLEALKKNQAMQVAVTMFVLTGVGSAATHTVEMYRAWVVTGSDVGKSVYALEQKKLWELNPYCLRKPFKYEVLNNTKVGTIVCDSGDVVVSRIKENEVHPKFKWVSWRALNTSLTFVSEAQAGGVQFEQSPTKDVKSMRIVYDTDGSCIVLYVDPYSGNTVESQPCISDMVDDGG